MDINLTPAMNGVEATTKIVEKYPGTHVLALTMNKSRAYVEKMLSAGALGFVVKDADKDELIAAVEATARGENYFSKQVALIMVQKYIPKKVDTSDACTPDELTNREKEILVQIAAGLTGQEIAKKLFISPRTVDTHRRNLQMKVGARNTAGLVSYAWKHSLVE